MPVSAEVKEFIAELTSAEDAGPALRDGADASRLLDIKDARAGAREAERLETRETAGSPEGTRLRAEARRWWTVVAEGVPELLSLSRDIDLLGWYCEAQLRLEGLPGLRDAFALTHDCVTHFWDKGLHPQESDEGPGERIASLVALNGEEQPGALIRPLRMTALAFDSEDQPVGLWQAQSAGTRALFETSVRAAAITDVRVTYQAAQEALDSYERLGKFLRGHVGIDGFPIGFIKATLEEIIASLVGVFPAGALDPVVEVAEDAGAVVIGSDGVAVRTAPAAATGEINNREDAIKAILKVADFFDKADPHSMIGQSLRDAARRARLSWQDYLEELIPNSDARKEFLVRAGILTKE